jgi:signal peptidase I
MSDKDGESVASEPDADSGANDARDADELTGRRRRGPAKKRPFWIELPILIVIAFGLTFLIQTFVAKVYYVPSGSMEQTLHGTASGGDRILANKIVYDFRDPQQGDVVVFAGPATWAPEARIAGPTTWFGSLMQSVGSVVGIAPPNEKDYVKRVIAVGGQTVMCCDAEGAVTVDGRSLVEPYIYEPIEFVPGQLDCTTTQMSRRCFGPVTIPEGELWVMGDHRSDSADSSYQCQGLPPTSGAVCQGPIPVDNVIGKAIFIVMPPSRWGTIGNPDIDPDNPAN